MDNLIWLSYSFENIRNLWKWYRNEPALDGTNNAIYFGVDNDNNNSNNNNNNNNKYNNYNNNTISLKFKVNVGIMIPRISPLI